MNGNWVRQDASVLQAGEEIRKAQSGRTGPGNHGAAKLTNEDSAAYARAIALLKPPARRWSSQRRNTRRRYGQDGRSWGRSIVVARPEGVRICAGEIPATGAVATGLDVGVHEQPVHPLRMTRN